MDIHAERVETVVMKTKTTLAALALITVLAGCSAAPTITPAGPAATQDTVQTAPAPEPTKAPESPKLGDTATFSDGLQVTITGATQPAGQYATNAIDGVITVLTITLTNTGANSVNAVFTALPTVTAGTAGNTVNNAFDENVGVDTVGEILPGETRTIKAGYGIATADLGTVRVEVKDPDLTGPSVVFKGAIS